MVALFSVASAARKECFAETLHGYVLYPSNGCETDTDCVDLCDCGAVCMDVMSGCNATTASGAPNPDPQHICNYLSQDGEKCTICPSGKCGLCASPYLRGIASVV